MRPTHIKWAIGVLILCAMTAPVVAWQRKARSKSRFRNPTIAREESRAIPVRTETVTKQWLNESVGGTGVSIPSRTARITLTAEGDRFGFGGMNLKQVHCRQGQWVTKGQILFEFNDRLFQQAIQYRKSVVAQAEQTLVLLRELATKQTVSEIELLSAERDFETARFDLAVAQANLEQCTITSPIDGVVDQVEVVCGMLITGNQLLTTIHCLDPILVQMDFPAEQIGMLELGQKTMVDFDSFPHETLQGRVVQIAPSADQRERILPVTVELENSEKRLRAGLTAFLRVIAERREATMIPKTAVISSDRESMVFAVNQENRATALEVQIGTATHDDLVEVRQGVAPGNRVVIFGQDHLENNDLVNDDWRVWTGYQSSAN